MGGSVRERCRTFTTQLRTLPDAVPFLRPVDTALYPDYLAKIAPAEPIDLSHVARRLRDRERWYQTFPEFCADLRQMFANARR
jgi:hypothetical protein